MPRICWNCKYFIATDSLSVLTGVCVRHAPKNADYQSYQIADQESCFVQVGVIDPLGAEQSGVVLPLAQSGLFSDLPTCHATDLTGINADDIIPIITPVDDFHPVAFRATAAKMNTGAGTVGANPVLHLQCVSVDGIGQSPLWTVDIPVTNARANGTAGDSFASGLIQVDSSRNLERLIGLRVDLTGTTSNDIAEIRNLQISMVLKRTVQRVTAGSATTLAKWGQISDGSTQSCGEFCVSDLTIPPIPVPPV